ncbi:TPA: hypothetical protein DEP94_02090 [Candidatus Nomurabacteria bacterium]|nr:hypothetical protein [Candidatus Nomurabacteria bacterium]
MKNLFTKLSMRSVVVSLFALAIAGFTTYQVMAAGVVTPATGGTSVSIDTSSASAGVAWTSLGGGPIITEGAVGDISTGIHTLTLPAGWEFNTAQNVTIGINGTTELTLGASVVTPGTNTLSFNITGVSSATPAVLTFSDLQVRPTGTVIGTGNITMTSGVISGVDGTTNFGTLTTVAGVATKVKVETLANGSGSVVSSQSLTSGSTLTVYGVTRDQFDNYVGNTSTTWTITGATGGVSGANLSASPATSVTLTGAVVGTGVIHAVNGGLTTGDSGTITVTPGAAASLSVTSGALAGTNVDAPISAVTVQVLDAAGNTVVDGTSVTVSKVAGSGTLSGTLTTTTTGGNAVFSNIQYNKISAFTVKFTANSIDSATSNSITLTAGTATKVNVETATDGSGSVVSSQSVVSGATLTVYGVTRDQYDNYVGNPADTVWTMATTTGGVTGTNLSASPSANVTFTGALVGTGLIHAVNGALAPGDSGTITVTVGAVNNLTVSQVPTTTGTVDDIFTTQPWILVSDLAGNPISGRTITASLAVGAGTLRTTLTAVSGVDGLAKFTDLGYSKTDAFQLHFADGAVTVNAVAFGPLTAGAANTLTFTTPATGGNAATAVLTTQPVVHVVDQYGNLVVNGTTVTASKLTGTGTLRTTLTATTVSGDATFTDLAYDKIDSFTIRFTSNTHTVDSASLSVIAGAATKVNVETAADGSGTVVPAQALASGSTLTVYGVTRDVYDNYVGNPSTTWTLTNKTGGVIDGNLGASPATSVTMTGVLSGSAVIHGVSGAFNSDSGTITVTNGPATKYVIINPADGTVDASIPVTVQLQDANNNIVTTGGDKDKDVTLTVDGAAVGGVVDIVNGVGTLNVVDHTAQTVNLSLSSPVLVTADVTSTQNVVFGVGAVTKVNVETAANGSGTVVPASSLASGSTLTVYGVTRDQYDNYVGNPGTTVWSLTSLTGNVVATDISPVDPATGANTVMTGLLSGSAIIHAVNGAFSSNSGTITVTNGPATKYVIINPADGTVDAPITVTVQLQDANNNIVTTGGDKDTDVTLATDGTATGAGLVDIVNGVGTLNISDQTAQTVNLSLSNTPATAFTKTSTQNVVFAPGVVTHLSVSGITDPVVSGVASSVTVTAQDQYNNTNPLYTGTVAFTSSDVKGSTVLPTNYAFIGGDNGTKTFAGGITLTTTGEQTVTVTDTVTASITGTQSAITVTPASLNKFAIGASPTSVDITAQSTITVTGQDTYGNTVTNDSTTVALLNSDGGASLTNGFLTLTSGVATTQLAKTSTGVSHVVVSSGSVTPKQTTVTFTDAADRTAPVISSVSTDKASYEATNDTNIIVTVVEDNTASSVSVNGNSASETTPGTWTVTFAKSSSIGTHSLAVNVADISGNVSTSNSSYNVVANAVVTVTPTVVLSGTAIVSAYSVTEANSRFATGVQFTVTNDASVTVNGVTSSVTGGVVTSATNSQAKTLGAHTYNVVVTSSTGHTASVLVSYQVNADSVTPVLPTVAIAGPTIVSSYTATAAGTRFASGLQFTTTNGVVTTVNGTTVASGPTIDADTLSGATTLGAHTYNVIVTSSTGHTSNITVSYQVNADSVTPVIPTITIKTGDQAIVSAYSLAEAQARFASGLQFTTTNGATTTVNGTITASGATVNADTLSGATTLGAHTYNVIVTSSSDHTANMTVSYQVNANSVAPVTPTVVISGIPVVSAYSVTEANSRFATGVQFTVTNDASVTVNGVTASVTGGVVTAADNTASKTLGAHTYNVVVTSSTGHTANATVSYQVNADSVTPVTPTVAINGTAIVSAYTVTEANARFASGIQFDTTNATGITVNGSSVAPASTITGASNANAKTLGAHTYNVIVTSSTGHTANVTVTYQVNADPVVQGNGTLAVTGINTVNSTMTADDSFTNGGSWTFLITVPTTETNLALKFGDWVSGSNSIATANNMRIYSAQSSNATGTSTAITITAANTYSTNLTLTSDLDANTEGRQVSVTVDLKVPAGTAGGSYSTNYGAQSN